MYYVADLVNYRHNLGTRIKHSCDLGMSLFIAFISQR